ncbi:MAG: hypothetical protein PSV26_08615 [Polaromonas sp.]|uniref:hypothetical protein n=1 Tax=Polaromonas sp. TaxID=1869339 RepID=UPI002489DCF9|nr:hypothetical protein [Polaromonas sp.]MDI1237529.1 hypothetical protein [Polaromonas sp.]
MLQIYFDRIQNVAPRAALRVLSLMPRRLPWVKKQAEKAALRGVERAHPAPEEAGLTPRQHTAFAPQGPRLHGMLAAVFLCMFTAARSLKGQRP